MFSVHDKRGKIRAQQSPVILDLCLRKTQSGNHVIIMTSSFSKSSVLKMFSVHAKAKSRRFLIPPVWRAFFSWHISVDGRPNHRNKATFQISSKGRNLFLLLLLFVWFYLFYFSHAYYTRSSVSDTVGNLNPTQWLCLIDWLIDWLADWLIDWLID